MAHVRQYAGDAVDQRQPCFDNSSRDRQQMRQRLAWSLPIPASAERAASMSSAGAGTQQNLADIIGTGIERLARHARERADRLGDGIADRIDDFADHLILKLANLDAIEADIEGETADREMDLLQLPAVGGRQPVDFAGGEFGIWH